MRGRIGHCGRREWLDAPRVLPANRPLHELNDLRPALVWPRCALRAPFLVAAAAFLPFGQGTAQAAMGGHLPLEVACGYLLGATIVSPNWLMVHPPTRAATMLSRKHGRLRD